MQSLGLDEDNPTEIPIGFWARQFHDEPTASQRKFDWAFGLVIPALCFYFDPIVFRGNYLGLAMFANYKPLAYTLGFVSMMAMTAFLLWGVRLKWVNGLFAGLFGVGAIISLIVGIFMFPLSLLCLLIGIGALGFTPLFSSIVFARNAIRAFYAAKPFFTSTVLIRTVALAAILSATVPFTVNSVAQKSIDVILKGEKSEWTTASQKLALIATIVNFDQLAFHYHRSTPEDQTSERGLFIAEFYEQMTGTKVEDGVYLMMD